MGKEIKVGNRYYDKSDRQIIRVEEIDLQKDIIYLSGYKQEHGYCFSKNDTVGLYMYVFKQCLKNGEFTSLFGSFNF